MAARRMRMAELVRLSGVPRETIHYYLREGLLPPPERSGKTSAFYREAHLERLRLIRQLRDEKYLPVAVIRSVLEAGLEAGLGPDLDTLAEVLAIDPTLGQPASAAPAPTAEALEAALELGLFAGEPPREDPTALRVLAAISEALALGPEAASFTLEDMRVSAPRVSALVRAEAAAFFDLVVSRGDVAEAVRALRAGRAPVAHFLTAYRDWILRRIVDDLLGAIRDGARLVARSRLLELGPGRLDQLGDARRREALRALAEGGDPAAANTWVWHLCVLGLGRQLAELSPEVTALLRPRAALLRAHAAAERGLGSEAAAEAILADKGPFPLGEVLMAELGLTRALERAASRGGTLEHSVPALHRLFSADPSRDADPLASAFAHLRRGMVGLALPPAFGRAERAEQDLERALGVLLSAPGRVHPALVARIEGNARLALGRARLGSSRDAEARVELQRAQEIDPAGPIGDAARALLAGTGTEILSGETAQD
jgi:DNA-binding transcriptional MerR regulator